MLGQGRRPIGSLAIVGCLACLLLSQMLWSCKNPVGSPYSNTLPETGLANVPANDTIAQYIRLGAIPEQTLYWVGNDPDGYVVAFRYRWTDFYQGQALTTGWTTILNLTSLVGTTLDTLILVRGTPSSVFRIYNFFATLDPSDFGTHEAIRDSLSTGRVFAVPYQTGPVRGDSVQGANPVNLEAPTKGIFIFYSPVDSNMHRFEVASVDNSDGVDPSPGTIHFWTLRSPGPIPFFATAPANGQMILTYPTEVNSGLTFTFGALDPSTDQRDYTWVIDDTVDPTRWSPWNLQPRAVITGQYFQQTGSDTHTIYLRARNRWGVIGPTASRVFTAIIPPIDDPSWPRRILIINNCRISGQGAVDSTVVKSFYSEVMDSLGKTGQFDIWTTSSHPGGTPVTFQFPPRDVISRYTAVLLLSEQNLRPSPPLGVQNLINQPKLTILYDYLRIGGKLIWSGTPDIRLTFSPLTAWTPWARDIFHITDFVPFSQDPNLDFVGAKGIQGYPSVVLDSTKVTADSGYAIRNIAVNFPRGFGQTISLFDSKNNDPRFENLPLGIKFLAPPAVPPARQTYSVVYFGFPLYYARKSDVIQSFRVALSDLNE